jgi:hypothetical protein
VTPEPCGAGDLGHRGVGSGEQAGGGGVDDPLDIAVASARLTSGTRGLYNPNSPV